jgi:F-type H+-transporting ATPase subunit b
MPQLSQLDVVFLSQWFWLALVLGAIYFFVGKGIVPKVEETVDQRDAQIAADLAEAERLRDEADEAEEGWRAKMNEAHSEVQSVTGAAKDAAAKDAEKRVTAADKRLDKKLADAAAELDEARKAALAEIEGMAADATREIVAKLTGADVDATAARTAVAGALNRV